MSGAPHRIAAKYGLLCEGWCHAARVREPKDVWESGGCFRGHDIDRRPDVVIGPGQRLCLQHPACPESFRNHNAAAHQTPIPCPPLLRSLFKGIKPLWGRQIPYTMMKFGAFENTVQAIYKYAMPKPKSECSKGEQLGVSFAAGYIAGVFCAVVSHPADNLVSKLNAQKGATVGDIVKEMGWYALFTRGLGLRIIMIGTLTGLQWGIYDAFKVGAGKNAREVWVVEGSKRVGR